MRNRIRFLCLLLLACLLCYVAGAPKQLKRFNAELSYKNAKQRRKTARNDIDEAAAALQVPSTSSRSVVSSMYLTNKLSALDLHSISLAHYLEGNEHVT